MTLGGYLKINRLGYGTMRLVGEGAWGEPPDREDARNVLRRAIELGIPLLDTADAYGLGIAEELIAEALHPYPADLVIATKGGLTRQGPSKATCNAGIAAGTPYGGTQGASAFSYTPALGDDLIWSPTTAQTARCWRSSTTPKPRF